MSETHLDETIQALYDIIAVEPVSATTRLDVTEWADALDKAQRIARDCLINIGAFYAEG